MEKGLVEPMQLVNSPGFPFIGMSAVFISLVVLFLFILPALLMWLWNLTLPQLFGWSRLGYWQAFRLQLISALLFGAVRFM